MKTPTPEAFRLFHFGAQELARVEANGIAVDTARLDAASARVAAEVKELEARLLGDRTWRRWKREFGDKATLTSDVQLGHVLFKLLKVPYPWEGDEDGRTKTGRYFTDAETLDRVDLPFVKDHQRMKRLLKLESTYLSGIRREVVDGFIHCVFNLHLVDTFRSSASDINIQNQYSRDPEFAEIIRSCFTARHSDWCLSEIDYGALEFCIAASVWDDPAMIGYANDPAKDVHRDMAAELYLCDTAQVTKAMRSIAKNKFVFPVLYGSYYVSCARSLWAAAADMTGPDGKTPLRDHLKARGITRLGKLDPRSTPAPDTYEAVVKRVEEGFYARFPKFATGKKKLLESYRKTGRVDYVTGFRITSSGRKGVLSVNNLLNSKIQGPGFHCLLLSMVKLGPEMRRRKLKSLMVGEIHDCILFDGPEGELQDLLTLARRVMTEDVPAEWPWIKSKLKAEVDVTPPGGAWSEKRPWECVNGTWQPKGKK